MVKFFVYFCKMIRHICIVAEGRMTRCTKRHRLKIIYLLHPISCSLMMFVVGLFLYYEMFYILPELYDPSGALYKLHWFLALFVVHNVVGNMIYCFFTDTSFLSLPKDRLNPIVTEAHLWHLCTHCQMLVPPRTWHCRLCNRCMLKRDHHCNVTANCIGHRNQRYFVALLLHLTLGCLASFGYNVLHLIVVRMPIVGDPIALFASFEGFDATFMSSLEVDASMLIINGAVVKLSLFALVLVAGQLGFQVFLIARGSSMFDIWNTNYNLGFWTNVRLVLGKRMFWTLVSPLIASPQPHDGTQWQQPKEIYCKKPV
ncbi:hypothetical protein KR222_004146 [Zaprionus bogoriensis]|nr:hypothetical protein KR222_004146 [Zaprionus bogoriensis]